MRAAKWIAGVVAALVLLAVALVLIVTLVVDPNRFRGRVETLVQQASGQPFRIRGDLDIAWYPWLSLKIGAASLGEGAPLVEWKSASFGARLIPLLKGELIVNRVRLHGLRVHLERGADGRGNWQGLLDARGRSTSGAAAPQIAGIEIRDGALEYLDARTGLRFALEQWKLDAGEWRPGRPTSLDTSFELRREPATTAAIAIEMSLPEIRMQSEPLAADIPKFDLRIANAALSGSLKLDRVEPFQAQGVLVMKTASLREWLAELSIGGPRPRDASTLGELRLETQWTLTRGAFAAKPVELSLDDTNFAGEIARPAGEDSILRFELCGDHIELDRYTVLEDTSAEPFELPIAELRSLPVAGVLSFAKARIAGAQIENARIRLETKERM